MKTILIIYDEVALQSGISSMMSMEFPSLRVLGAENVDEGIQLACAEKPDLILLDSNIPLMNGYQTAQILKGLPQTCHIPLIGISGRRPQEPGIWKLGAVCDSWLTKPFTLDKLLSKLSLSEKEDVST